MPRKKPTTNELSTPTPPAIEPQAQPKARVSRRKTPEPAPAPPVEVTKPTRRARKVEEEAAAAIAAAPEPEAPSTPPARKPARRSKKVVEPPTADAVEAEIKEAATPAKRNRRAKAEAVAAVEAAVETPAPQAPAEEVPRTGRGRRPARRPAQKTSVAPPGDDIVGQFDENDLPIPIWRPRSKSASPAALGSQEGERTREPGDRSRRRRGRDKAIEITAEGAIEVDIEPAPVSQPVEDLPVKANFRERKKREDRKPAAKPEPVVAAPVIPELPAIPEKPLSPTPPDAPP